MIYGLNISSASVEQTISICLNYHDSLQFSYHPTHKFTPQQHDVLLLISFTKTTKY